MADRRSDQEIAPFRPSEARVSNGPVQEEETVSPVELVVERMHGRWLWAVLLAAILGPIGAAAGYLKTTRKYVAQGLIYVERRIEVHTIETPETGRLDDFGGVVGEQAILAQSDRVLAAALEDPRLHPFRHRLAGGQTKAISGGLNARPVGGTGFVTVEFESDDPDFSAAVTNSVLEAFTRIAAPSGEKLHTAKLTSNRELLREVRQKIDQKNAERLEEIRRTPYGSPDLDGVLNDRVGRLRGRETEVAALDESMKRIRAGLAMDAGSDPPDDAMLQPTALELDEANPTLPTTRRQLDRAMSDLDQARRDYGPSHRIRQQAERGVESLRLQVQREETLARTAWDANVGTRSRFGELKERKQAALAEIERLKMEIGDLVHRAGALSDIGREIARLSQDEEKYVERVKQLEIEGDAIRRGRIEITPALTPPTPTKDKRFQMAVLGGVAGSGLAFGLIFLLGAIDRRTYGATQLATRKGKLLLAGAIPDMDETMADAEGADLATNCVHRIRTRIETRRTPGDGYVLMVSSAFQGDGKTTVAVALAWSYAESGTRTLLVDCDFIGQALTHQFDKLDKRGVREALQGESTDDLVLELGSPLLSILPVGADRTFGASRVHPAALRRLFRELRERYEIIIVDTGPMTASIEALPVASAADGVLLSLRRGRSRARLEECIRDVHAAGAEYLGVVLNCADKKDCIRYGSVSKMSYNLSRALEGGADKAPKHPLLEAMQVKGSDDA